ncbi:MAG: AAA family ATPase [Sulfolobales archaeon]
MSERRVVDIKVLWTNLYRSVRTFLLTFVKPIESSISYRVVEAFIRRKELIDELSDDKYHLLLKVNLRNCSLNANELSYSLIPLTLTYVPKVVSEKGEYTLGIFLFEGFSKPKLIASAITVNKERDLKGGVKYLRPVLISLTPDLSDPAIKRYSNRISRLLLDEVLMYFNKYAPKYFEALSSLELMKPLVVMTLRSGFEAIDEIKAVVSDGSEYREIRIPIKIPSWSFNDLPPKVVEDVKTIIVNPIVKGYNFAPKGAFITGPPGVGKSVMAESLASSLNLKIVELRPSLYRSMWYGATEKMLNAIFHQIIKRRSDVALIIDDAEFVSSRKYTIHEAHVSEISTMLYHLQRPDRPFTILTANNPELIDPALLRPGRIDVSIVLGFPDKVMRRKILERNIGKYKIKVDDTLIDQMVSITKWFSAAEVDAFVRLAASRGDGRITAEDVEWARKKISVNYSERKSMQEFLRWWVSKTQGMVITYLPSENEIE